MIAEKLLALAAATKNEIYDPEWNGGEWMIGAVETHETIENFIDSSDKYWAESTSPKMGEIAGMKFVAWKQMQIKKGAQRQALSVIDFGDARFAIDCDLTDFT